MTLCGRSVKLTLQTAGTTFSLVVKRHLVSGDPRLPGELKNLPKIALFCFPETKFISEFG